eukprot:97398_1
MENDLQALEEELKLAEQEYLDKIECIVAKFRKRAIEFKTKSLNEYKQALLDTTESKPILTTHKSKEPEIELQTETAKPSGYTPSPIQKIRESLKRGQMLYQMNKKKTHNDDEGETTCDDDDDDLNIIPLNHWTRKLQHMSGSNHLNKLEHSLDSNKVEIHKGNICNNSTQSASSSLSLLSSSSLKYDDSKKLFKTQMIMNRFKRKRKYALIEQEMNENDKPRSPPKKRRNYIQNIDLMSSRDLKNELNRIYKTRGNATLHRNNINRKSLKAKSMNRMIHNMMKSNETESDSDDDVFIPNITRKFKRRSKRNVL